MSANVHLRTNPKLVDGVIAEIQQRLAAQIEWFTNIYGRVERLKEEVDGQTYYTANVYKSGNDYTLIAPDSGLGNFAFFTVDEPEDVEQYIGEPVRIQSPCSLIVWVDLRTIPSGENRNTEAVKNEILHALNSLYLRYGRFYISKIYNRAESIFKGFSLDEVNNQFLMQPYCGWRFEGEIDFVADCVEVVPPEPPVEPQYIRGHFTDGRTSFTFNINRYEPITVEVDKNGWWKWDVDRTITSLYECCLDESITILDYIEIVGVDLSNITSYYFGFGRNLAENDGQRIIDMSRCKGSIKFNPLYFAYRAKCLWYMPNIDIWSNGLTLQTQSRIIAKGYIKANMNIGNLNNLLKNNIISIIEAAAANVTYTLHATIYAKCANGGEWHTEIQAAIDAKAAQGYTVTLISA